jgi:hypothetical protein
MGGLRLCLGIHLLSFFRLLSGPILTSHYQVQFEYIYHTVTGGGGNGSGLEKKENLSEVEEKCTDPHPIRKRH